MNNDPNYRKYFKQTLRKFIEQELDINYLLGRLQHYRKLEESASVLGQNQVTTENVDIAEFLKHRGAFILSHLNQLEF